MRILKSTFCKQLTVPSNAELSINAFPKRYRVVFYLCILGIGKFYQVFFGRPSSVIRCICPNDVVLKLKFDRTECV